jgi:hypothetical protein
MIHVRKPVKVFQSVKLGGGGVPGQRMSEHKEIPSPMMFSRVIYGLKDPLKGTVEEKCVAPDETKQYLNAWNFR